ncbi:hypothetical protein ACFSTE_21370 [Aquimarina hainanensis]|uniref:Uncharacterized protein n=1 Tax=Aquimarina hainanensis TaxID=1578017 RepID=A0ABW5NF08_9FLAO
MKKHLILCILLMILGLPKCIAQEIEGINRSYEEFLKKKDADTTITKSIREYVCSEDVKGRVTFYYQKDTLQLIIHRYKQGFYNDPSIEYYYIENNQLALVTTFSEIIHMNTYSHESKERKVAGVEKVLELVENRTFINKQGQLSCRERRYGRKLSEWDQTYFDTLPFNEQSCPEHIEEIRSKYRLLQKVEKKFKSIYYKNKKGCIFYLW